MSDTASGQKEILKVLASFAPTLSAPGFVPGQWNPSVRDDTGLIALGFFSLSEESQGFYRAVNQLKIMRPFNWQGWSGREEVQQLLADPKAIVASASYTDLWRLLTYYSRTDRFIDGALYKAFEGGFMAAICQRAAILLQQMDA